MAPITTSQMALDFIRAHGVVLASASGPAPRLTDAIAGEPVKGSWWSHPEARLIFALTESVRSSDEILACRLIQGKLTFVHQRLWPAFARIADRLSPDQCAQVIETHTAAGRHATSLIAFPLWLPAQAMAEANAVDEADALALFAPFMAPPTRAKTPR